MQQKSSYKVNTARLTKLRERRGLTIEALAKRAIVDVNTLRRWLKGQPASLTSLDKVATALGVRCDVLIASSATELLPPDAPSSEEFKADGWIVLSVRVPGDKSKFNQLIDVPELVERIEELVGPAGRIELAYVTDGSLIIGLAFELEADAAVLIRVFCEFYDQTLPEMIDLPFDQLQIDANGFDPSHIIAKAMAERVFHPKEFSIPTILENDLRKDPEGDWHLIVCSSYFQGRCRIRRYGSRWVISTRLFYQIDEIALLQLYAEDLDAPELVAGEIPSRLQEDESETAQWVRARLKTLDPVFLP